jgi:predicted O-methyltransferase YrrM
MDGLSTVPHNARQILSTAAYNALRMRDPEARRVARWRHGAAPRTGVTEVFPGIEHVDVTTLRAFDRTVDTSIDPYELLVLCAIARFRAPATILEIGTFDGGTTLNLAANTSQDARVVTVDLPEGWDGEFSYDVPADLRNFTGSEGPRRRQYAGTAYEERIRQVYGDSAQLDWTKLADHADLVFIDGNHYRDYVVKDTEGALSVLAPGGLIVWHDYSFMKDVADAVDSFQASLDIRAISGTRLAVGWRKSEGLR